MNKFLQLEQKLPVFFKRAGIPQITAVLLLLVSVLGIGGAKLTGYYNNTIAGFNKGKYSITADMDQRVSAAANVVTVAKKISGVDAQLVQTAEQALSALEELKDPKQTYADDQLLNTAIEALYDAVLPLASSDQKALLSEQHSEFLSRGTILRNNSYNEEAKRFNEDRSAFPANLIGMLWGVGDAVYFE